MSDSPGLTDFAIGIVNSALNLSDGMVKFLEEFKLQLVKSILLIKMVLGVVEMTFGLVYASFSLPEWQALKVTFFAPWPYLRFEKQVYRNYRHTCKKSSHKISSVAWASMFPTNIQRSSRSMKEAINENTVNT